MTCEAQSGIQYATYAPLLALSDKATRLASTLPAEVSQWSSIRTYKLCFDYPSLTVAGLPRRIDQRNRGSGSPGKAEPQGTATGSAS